VSDLRYSMLDDDWVASEDGSFESVLNESTPEQRLLFSDRSRARLPLAQSGLKRKRLSRCMCLNSSLSIQRHCPRTISIP
jgi:hypothetical protein